MNSIPIHSSWYVIFNPVGGRARRSVNRHKVESALRAAGIDYELQQTEHADDAQKLATEAFLNGFRRFVVAGGDGTAHGVLNGLLTAQSSHPGEVTIGILPLGTGNDWARTLGIPRKLTDACLLLKNGRAVSSDVGTVAYIKQEQTETRYFINIAGAGFDGHVVRLVQGRPSGRMQYLFGLIKACRSFQAPQLSIQADNWQHTGPVLAVFVSNGSFLGGGMRIAPQAKYDDGLFEVTVIKNIRPLNILLHIPMLLFGTIANSRYVLTTQAGLVTIDGSADTQADGEFLGHPPATFRIIRNAIKVMINPTSLRD
ncbi:MAG: diacylglycerol kinase family protein [Pseudomonadales bacterium]